MKKQPQYHHDAGDRPANSKATDEVPLAIWNEASQMISQWENESDELPIWLAKELYQLYKRVLI